MASLQQLAQGTANERLSAAEDYQLASLQASGFEFEEGKRLKDSHGITIRFNGGIASRIVARLERSERVFRFTDSRRATTPERRASGYWWFDEECYRTLRKLTGYGSFRETARTHFAVLPEWGDMAHLVTGTMKRDFWCLKGMSAPAEDSKNKIVGQFTLDVLQIFVPGALKMDDLENVRDMSRMIT